MSADAFGGLIGTGPKIRPRRPERVESYDSRRSQRSTFLEVAAEVINDETEQTPLIARDGAQYLPEPWNGLADFVDYPWWRKPNLWFLLPPFFLFTIAFGGLAVPKLNIMMTLVCREYLADKSVSDMSPVSPLGPPDFNGGDDKLCNIPPVHAQLARLTLMANLAAGLLSAITAPWIGALSDRYGRTRLMVLSTAGTFSGEILTLLCAKYPDTFPIRWIILGFVIDGLCGSFISVHVCGASYATDTTPPDRRVIAFGYFQAFIFIGMALGPIIVSLVVELSRTVLSAVYFAIGAHIVFILFLLLVVPDSLSPRQKALAQEKYASTRPPPGVSTWSRIRKFNPFEPLKVLYPTGPGTTPALRRNLLLLACVDGLVMSVVMGSMSVILIYIRFQFDWDNLQQSLYVSAMSTCRVIVLLVILPLVVWFFRTRHNRPYADRNTGSDFLDLALIRLALAFDVIGYLGFSLARDSKLFIASAAVATLGGMGSASLQSALTKHVPASRVGELLGALGLLHAIMRVIAPTFFSFVYSVTVGKFTQTVFVILCSLFAVAHGVSWFIKPHIYLLDSAEEPLINDRDEEEEH